MSGNVRLNVKSIFLGIKTASHIKRKGLRGAAAKLGGHLANGDGVHIHNTVEALVKLAVVREVLDRTQIVSYGEISAGLYARKANFSVVYHIYLPKRCISIIIKYISVFHACLPEPLCLPNSKHSMHI